MVLTLIEAQDPTNQETWRSRFVLLLWLSIVVIIPFHMSRLDGFAPGQQGYTKVIFLFVISLFSSKTKYYELKINYNETQTFLPFYVAEAEQKLTVMERIFNICKTYAMSKDTCAEASAYLASKFLIRYVIMQVEVSLYELVTLAETQK